jgi:peptide/nickel transport system permease protein
MVFFLPYIYTTSAYTLNPSEILSSPSLSHPLGTDRLGRDILARVLQGGQTSLIIGFLSAIITSLIGLFIGINAGYFKGKIDVSYIQASTIILIIVISITGWMGMARLIRSESFAISNKPYIKVLKLANVSNSKIIFKYFAPLLAPLFLISFTFTVGGAILAESGLSFLGLGINPPNMSWGSLLSDGKAVIDIAWWVSFFPGLMIFLVTFSLIQISDFLQQKLNTKDIL